MKEKSDTFMPICPECGKGHLFDLTHPEDFEFDLGDEKIQVHVPAVHVETCDNCGVEISGPEAAAARHEAICRAAGLLSPAEIRTIREQLGWSQQYLADLTGFGVATVSRCERGRLLHSRSLNTVMVAIRDCPPFREHLEARHAARMRGGDDGRASSAPLAAPKLRYLVPTDPQRQRAKEFRPCSAAA
jgi:putative zinc finger/helix-turn-helix YgiT family protein